MWSPPPAHSALTDANDQGVRKSMVPIEVILGLFWVILGLWKITWKLLFRT